MHYFGASVLKPLLKLLAVISVTLTPLAHADVDRQAVIELDRIADQLQIRDAQDYAQRKPEKDPEIRNLRRKIREFLSTTFVQAPWDQEIDILRELIARPVIQQMVVETMATEIVAKKPNCTTFGSALRSLAYVLPAAGNYLESFKKREGRGLVGTSNLSSRDLPGYYVQERPSHVWNVVTEGLKLDEIGLETRETSLVLHWVAMNWQLPFQSVFGHACFDELVSNPGTKIALYHINRLRLVPDWFFKNKLNGIFLMNIDQMFADPVYFRVVGGRVGPDVLPSPSVLIHIADRSLKLEWDSERARGMKHKTTDAIAKEWIKRF